MYPAKPNVFRIGDFFYSLVRPHEIMATKLPQKFVGSIAWADPAHTDEALIDRAILRSPDDLVVDFVYDGHRYTATFRRTAGNEFLGKYTTQWEGKPYEGNASVVF